MFKREEKRNCKLDLIFKQVFNHNPSTASLTLLPSIVHPVRTIFIYFYLQKSFLPHNLEFQLHIWTPTTLVVANCFMNNYLWHILILQEIRNNCFVGNLE